MPQDRNAFVLNLSMEEARAVHLAVNYAEALLAGTIIAAAINKHADIAAKAERDLAAIRNVWGQFTDRYHALGWCNDENCKYTPPPHE